MEKQVSYRKRNEGCDNLPDLHQIRKWKRLSSRVGSVVSCIKDFASDKLTNTT